MTFQQPEIRLFRAGFDGVCESCQCEIYEGDEIGYIPGDHHPSCFECVADEQD